jgi:DNA-binding GntR family transcriptional regulator
MVRVNGQDKMRIPVCWADLFVTDQYADLIRSDLPSYDGAAITLIESRHGRVAFQIQQTIRAAKLPEDVARILSAEPNTPALAITRRYLTVAQEPIISTFSLYPSDRFEYAVNLERNEML